MIQRGVLVDLRALALRNYTITVMKQYIQVICDIELRHWLARTGQ